MKITVKADFSKAYKLMAQLSGPKIKLATANALNDAAFAAQKVIQSEMDTSFNGVTAYVKKSIYVTRATPQNLTAVIEPKYMGGKGVDPKNILQASIFGGQRKRKRSEIAFERVGILPKGYSIVPGDDCPLDGNGNIRGSFVVQMISYFKAFGEQGYRANISDKRRLKLADYTKTQAGYRSINGVVYFIASGRLRSGRSSHLHPGIWAKSGTHGSNLKPIMMFVKTPTYKTRLDFFRKPTEAAMQKFDTRFRYQLRKLIEQGK